jgi:hypothetical protein
MEFHCSGRAWAWLVAKTSDTGIREALAEENLTKKEHIGNGSRVYFRLTRPQAEKTITLLEELEALRVSGELAPGDIGLDRVIFVNAIASLRRRLDRASAASGNGPAMLPAGDQDTAVTRAWVDRYRPALELALAHFLASSEWPERERFRRKLVQQQLDGISLDELLREMPRSSWLARQIPPDRVALSLQVLQELADAADLLSVCVTIIQRAYGLYCSEEQEPVLRSDDPLLAAASHDDGRLLLCARELLTQNPPGPLGGGTAGTDSTEWTRTLNEGAMPAFKNITTIAEYLTAQERIISDDPYRRAREWKPALPVTEQPVLRMLRTAPAVVSAASGRTELFVIMPFTEPWSDGTYAFIRRTVRRIDPSQGELSLYRADEIAKPGQITQHVKDAIAAAGVVIADVTHMNPNVMWELGYADGLGKTIVILNQDPGSSPFDMIDRRQVAYHTSPTEKDEEHLYRHLIEALRQKTEHNGP